MNIIIAATPDALALRAADDLMQWMTPLAAPLLCPASGDTPAGLYRELLARARKGLLNMDSWSFVGLDEWGGMNGMDEGSCRWHLDQQFFQPLGIKDERIQFFDGRAADLNGECSAAENFIREKGGIDLAILGLGLNGHVAMNEPGSSPAQRSHIADIHPSTQQAGQKYFRGFNQSQGQANPFNTDYPFDTDYLSNTDLLGDIDLSLGITLGLADLLEARYIFLMVTGAHKAAIIKEVLEGEITKEIPASLLRDHPGLTVYLDLAAAQYLTHHGANPGQPGGSFPSAGNHNPDA
ncbi:MAG TPA: glucosamine-6-phosphate deaminase [Puia sp.]|nr:glucosamine-6-phosphate deaminase [Puia sp.]